MDGKESGSLLCSFIHVLEKFCVVNGTENIFIDCSDFFLFCSPQKVEYLRVKELNFLPDTIGYFLVCAYKTKNIV